MTEILGVTGVILGITILVYLAVKGFDTILCSLIATAIVIVFNAQGFWDILDNAYLKALKDFVGNYLLLYVLGSVYGVIMERSGSAKMVAYTLLKVFGVKYSMLALILATSILNYGGISVFVIVFSIYPIAIYILKVTDTSKRFLPGLLMFAAGTYTMTTLPGIPTIMNLIPIPYLGTNIYAAPIMGTICSLFIFACGYMYLMTAMERSRRKGIGFDPAAGEIVEDVETMDISTLPRFSLAIIPTILVIVTIAIAQTMFSAINARNLGMFLAILFLLVTNINRLGSRKDIVEMMNQGISSSLLPIITTAAVVGFGGVVGASPAFSYFVDIAKDISADANPYVSGALSMNLLAGICGSSLGGTQIFYNTMIDTYLQMNINPEAFHRIMCIASSGLDSLPHCGAVITMFTVIGVRHKEAYMPVFYTSVVTPIAATALAIILAMIGIV